MVHQYKNNGYDIVLDVNSGAIHVVDDVTYDVIDFINQASVEQYSKEELIKTLSEKYNETEVKEALEEVQALIDEESLFTKDTYENYIMDFKKRPTVVKALCLHIAHDCNLACQYCFAEEGEYHGRRALMSFEVGKKALDFLIANSGSIEAGGASPAGFDGCICNPPYIESAAVAGLDRDVTAFEPLSALDGGRDGLDFYRAAAAGLPRLLRQGGIVTFEVGFAQAEPVAALLAAAGYADIRTAVDLQGVVRAVAARVRGE